MNTATPRPLSAADMRDIAAAAFRATQRAMRAARTDAAMADAQTAFEAASAAARLARRSAAARDAAEFATSALWALAGVEDENPAASARSYRAAGMTDQANAADAAAAMLARLAGIVASAITARLDWAALLALVELDGPDSPTPARKTAAEIDDAEKHNGGRGWGKATKGGPDDAALRECALTFELAHLRMPAEGSYAAWCDTCCRHAEALERRAEAGAQYGDSRYGLSAKFARKTNARWAQSWPV